MKQVELKLRQSEILHTFKLSTKNQYEAIIQHMQENPNINTDITPKNFIVLIKTKVVLLSTKA
jgi:hypothetical protein